MKKFLKEWKQIIVICLGSRHLPLNPPTETHGRGGPLVWQDQPAYNISRRLLISSSYGCKKVRTKEGCRSNILLPINRLRISQSPFHNPKDTTHSKREAYRVPCTIRSLSQVVVWRYLNPSFFIQFFSALELMRHPLWFGEEEKKKLFYCHM